MVEIERIYCLDLDEFEDRHWSSLGEIYRSLPGGYRELQIPMWFGDDEEHLPFLSASVEPPGIQVYGILTREAWAEWDAAFMAALGASELPFRKVGE